MTQSLLTISLDCTLGNTLTLRCSSSDQCSQRTPSHHTSPHLCWGSRSSVFTLYGIWRVARWFIGPLQYMGATKIKQFSLFGNIIHCTLPLFYNKFFIQVKSASTFNKKYLFRSLCHSLVVSAGSHFSCKYLSISIQFIWCYLLNYNVTQQLQIYL